MGEDQANVSSGLVLEGNGPSGAAKWQTCWGQSTPPAHAFIDYGDAALYDVCRAEAQVHGVNGVLAALQQHAPAQHAILMSWPPAMQEKTAKSLAASPPSSAWDLSYL